MRIGWALGAVMAGILAVPAWVEAKPKRVPVEGEAGAAEEGTAPQSETKQGKACPECAKALVKDGNLLRCEACKKAFDADGKAIACEACAKAACEDAACEHCKVSWGAGRSYACADCAKAAAASGKEHQQTACEHCKVSFRDGKKVEKGPQEGPRNQRIKRMPKIQGGGIE